MSSPARSADIAMFGVARAMEFYASLNGHGTLMKQEVVVTLIPEGAHKS